MYRSDNPLADFDRLDAEQTRWLKKRPRCSECDEHIQEDYAYYINDEWICEKCMERYRREVDTDYWER